MLFEREVTGLLSLVACRILHSYYLHIFLIHLISCRFLPPNPTRTIRILSPRTAVNSLGSRWPTSNGSNPTTMGQDQSSQEPSFKPEMSLSQCFHNIGSTDANLPLLREKNVWIGEGLAAQPQHEKAPPATPNDSEEKLDEVKHDNELFYCEACCNRGFSDSRTGGFNTRSLVKDGQKVCRLLFYIQSNAKKEYQIRFMDAWHDGAHLTFALGMLCSHRDTKDISFGLVSNDGSIHPDFRLLAVDHIPSKSKFMKMFAKKWEMEACSILPSRYRWR